MKKNVLVIYNMKRFVVSVTAAVLMLSALIGFGFFRLTSDQNSHAIRSDAVSVSYSVMMG